MERAPASADCTEGEFAQFVTDIEHDCDGHRELLALLEERHPVYDGRGTRALVRMRGWVLATLARVGLPDVGVVYALEELDTGRDPYLVAAAARALRSLPQAEPAYGPLLIQAIENLRHHDDLMSFSAYGVYGSDEGGTSALAEVLITLKWMGPAGRGILPALEKLLLEAQGGSFPASLKREIVAAISDIRTALAEEAPKECCQLPWGLGRRSVAASAPAVTESLATLTLEDHNGELVRFGEYFCGRPTFVAFFYTRCDNPRKCSLTIAKLARLQQRLAEQGLTERVRTAAVTYDPGWDTPDRMTQYGLSRQLALNADNRLLRCRPENLDQLRAHFDLGVNFVGSLVNRHKVEAYLLDSQGKVRVLFERLDWSEHEVTDGLRRLVADDARECTSERARAERPLSRAGHGAVSLASSVGLALWPKCPICWAAYLSSLGIAGVDRLPLASLFLPLLLLGLALNLSSIWLRSRSSGDRVPIVLAVGGTLTILLLDIALHLPWARTVGITVIVLGSVMSAIARRGARLVHQSPGHDRRALGRPVSP